MRVGTSRSYIAAGSSLRDGRLWGVVGTSVVAAGLAGWVLL